jgi:hypothetical protein
MLISLEGLAYISQALSLPLFAGSLFYGARQVRELRRQVGAAAQTQRLHATHDFLDIIAVDEVREARRKLFAKHDQPLNSAFLGPDERESAVRLAVAYDRVGLMVEHELLEDDLVYLWQGAEVIRLWGLVKPLVIEERRIRGRENYCLYFERMASHFADLGVSQG